MRGRAAPFPCGCRAVADDPRMSSIDTPDVGSIDPTLDLFAEIDRLREERKAVILAHFYQDPDIQDIADHLGDSLELAKRARDAKDAEVILFCGVHFMAETAKILNPEKVVVLPDLEAGCSLADSVPAGPAQSVEGEAPRPLRGDVHQLLGGGTKAESDIICTSSQRREDHRVGPGGPADPVRPGQEPRRVPDQEDGATDGPVAGRVHGARDVQLAEDRRAEGEAPGREVHRAPRVRGPRAAARRLRRLDVEAAAVRAGRRRAAVHRRHRDRHPAHDEEARAGQGADPGPVRGPQRGMPGLQQLPAHEAQHAREDLPRAARPEAAHRDGRAAARARAPAARSHAGDQLTMEQKRRVPWFAAILVVLLVSYTVVRLRDAADNLPYDPGDPWPVVEVDDDAGLRTALLDRKSARIGDRTIEAWPLRGIERERAIRRLDEALAAADEARRDRDACRRLARLTAARALVEQDRAFVLEAPLALADDLRWRYWSEPLFEKDGRRRLLQVAIDKDEFPYLRRAEMENRITSILCYSKLIYQLA